MKIHEYQGKEILRQFGVPVPRGIPAFTVQEAVEAAQIAERNSVAADWNAKAKIATLRGEGEADLEKAKGEAAAKRLRADAEEYYNNKVSASLRPVVIQQQYLGKWDGKLPQIITGGGQGPLLMLPSNLSQERNDKK